MAKLSGSEAITSGTPVRQIAVFLQNEVGALLAIVRLLNKNHVVVLGISVQESVDVDHREHGGQRSRYG